MNCIRDYTRPTRRLLVESAVYELTRWRSVSCAVILESGECFQTADRIRGCKYTDSNSCATLCCRLPHLGSAAYCNPELVARPSGGSGARSNHRVLVGAPMTG